VDRARAKRIDRTRDQVRLNQLKEAAAWKEAFGSEKGKECMELLRKEFYDIPTICVDSPVVTQVRAAQRDLVRYILDQLEITGE